MGKMSKVNCIDTIEKRSKVWKIVFNTVLSELDEVDTIYDIKNSDIKNWAIAELTKYCSGSLSDKKHELFTNYFDQFAFSKFIMCETSGEEWHRVYRKIIDENLQSTLEFNGTREEDKWYFETSLIYIRNHIPSVVIDKFNSNNLDLKAKRDKKILGELLKKSNSTWIKRFSNAIETFEKEDKSSSDIIACRKAFENLDIYTAAGNNNISYSEDKLDYAVAHCLWELLRDKYSYVLNDNITDSDQLIFIKLLNTNYNKGIFINSNDFLYFNKYYLDKDIKTFNPEIRRMLNIKGITTNKELSDYIFNRSRLKYIISTIERKCLFCTKAGIRVNDYIKAYNQFVSLICEYYGENAKNLCRDYKEKVKEAYNKYTEVYKEITGVGSEQGELIINENHKKHIESLHRSRKEILAPANEQQIIQRRNLFNSPNYFEDTTEIESIIMDTLDFSVLTNNLDKALNSSNTSLEHRNIIRYAVNKSNRILRGLEYSEEEKAENEALINYWLKADISIAKIAKGLSSFVREAYIKNYSLWLAHNKNVKFPKIFLLQYRSKLGLDDTIFIEGLSKLCNGEARGEFLFDLKEFNDILYKLI